MILADGVVVRDVDAGGNSYREKLDLELKEVGVIPGASKGEDLEGSEIGSRELIFLKVDRPGELWDHGWSGFDELAELGRV